MADESLDASYLQSMRRAGAYQALDEMLARNGMDINGQPLPQGAAPQAPQASATQHAAGTQERINKIRLDQKAEDKNAPSFMRDVIGGMGKELAASVGGGVTDAVREMLQSADDLASFIAEKTGTKKGGAFENLSKLVPEVKPNDTTGGQLVRGVSQFLTGFATGGKAVKAAGASPKVAPYLAGLFSDLAAFDPKDPTLSNLINELAPALKNPLTTFLATDPGDTDALNRFKRGIEGLGLGAATDAIIGIARNWRAGRALKKTEDAFVAAKKIKEEPHALGAQIEDPPAIGIEPTPPPNAAGQIDVVRQMPSIDIPVGTTGRGGIMQSERLLLPAPGQATRTADEIAASMIQERKARLQLEGNPTLQAAQEAITAKNEIIGNPTLRAAYETSLRGASEEQIVNDLVKRAKPELEAVAREVFTSGKESVDISRATVAELRRGLAEEPVRGVPKGPPLPDVVTRKGESLAPKPFLNQKGEISQEALYTIARAAVGGAIGLTQGETMEDRIANAVMGAGAGAALKPALLRKLVDGLRRVAPREMEVAKSFDAPTLTPTKKGVPRKPPGKVTPIEVASEAEMKAVLEADPAAIKVGNKALKIDWSEINDVNAQDDLIKTITKQHEETIDVARRGVQSDEKRLQLANMLGISEEDMLRRNPGQALNAEQTQAFIDVYGSAVAETDKLARALKSGENVEFQFRLMLGRTTSLTHQIFGARAEAGRSLRVWGQAAQQINTQGGLASQLDRLTVGGKSLDQIPAERLAEMLLSLDTTPQKATFLRQATTLGKSAVLEAWINGLLSNPVTHFANAVSNSMVAASSIIERAIAERIGKEVARGESAAMINGLAGGWMDALRLARKAFIEGESQMGLSKLDVPTRAITAENLHASGAIGKAVDMIGALVTTPGRALMAADDFFKAINYRMELHAQAWRQASREGVQPASMKARMFDLANDGDFASLVKDQLEGFAAYQTFNQPLGELGQGYTRFLKDHPLMRVVTPFVRTPTNIAKYTIERTPLINLAMKQVRDDLAIGGVKRDMALAKMAMGGLMFTTGATLAAGGFLTGSGPMDKDLRETKRLTGWQPYSIKIGDTYVSFARTDPIGFFLGMSADLVEKGGELNDTDLDSLAMAGVMALKETFVNKTYMKGLSDAMEALNSPDRKWANYFERLAGSLVPAGVAQLTRQLDPTIKEVNSAADAIFARLPGYGGPVRRNIWGEPIQLEGALGPDIVSPFYTSTKKDDPAAEEILRLDLSVGMPGRYVYGTRPTSGVFSPQDPRQGVELLPEEYSRYVELSGNELKLGGKGLKEKITETIESRGYQAQSDLGKSTLLQQLFNVYREAAQIQLRKEFPELDEAIREKVQERAAAMAGNQ